MRPDMPVTLRDDERPLISDEVCRIAAWNQDGSRGPCLRLTATLSFLAD